MEFYHNDLLLVHSMLHADSGQLCQPLQWFGDLNIYETLKSSLCTAFTSVVCECNGRVCPTKSDISASPLRYSGFKTVFRLVEGVTVRKIRQLAWPYFRFLLVVATRLV